MYNMLDFRAMLGRRVAWPVDPHTYSKVGCAFGRVPTGLHLGDFFQLRPTAQLSLLDVWWVQVLGQQYRPRRQQCPPFLPPYEVAVRSRTPFKALPETTPAGFR